MDRAITSVQNPRVRQWAGLLSKKGRDEAGKFIAEGIHLVKEALKAGMDVECVAYDCDRPLPDELAEVRANSACEWIPVSESVIAKCSSTQTPQHVFAVVNKRRCDESLLWRTEPPLVVLLDGVQDPGNVGTIIRSSEASGATAVILGRGTADPYNPKTVRAAMGSLFRIPIFEGDLLWYLTEARSRGIHVVSTAMNAERHCFEYDWTKATWFVVGNEGAGVSEEVSGGVDERISIPMLGQTESLNVAMATTVLLFEAMRQRTFSQSG